MTNYHILIGDNRITLKGLQSQSVNSCVTSPPYYGLRDYNNDRQIGQEPSPDKYIAELVTVFREIRRVLRDDGTLWINIGDSYATLGSGGYTTQTIKNGKVGSSPKDGSAMNKKASSFEGSGIKSKDLIGIPWMLAFALRADGWYLRQDIIWDKPNSMPESVSDRCTKSHEYIFLLSKSPTYRYDNKAIRETLSPNTIIDLQGRKTFDNKGTHGNTRSDLGRDRRDYVPADGMRNKRSVWHVNTRPYNGAHFAVYPPELITPCILAGCPVGGTVIDPFAGSGTTGVVALEHQRNAILCEVNHEYAKLIRQRMDVVQPSMLSDMICQKEGEAQ